MLQHYEIAYLLNTGQPRIARQVSDALWQSQFWREQVAGGRPEALLAEVRHALTVLQRSIRHRAPMIWHHYLQWLWQRVQLVGGSRGRVRELVALLWAVCAPAVPPASQIAVYNYLHAGLRLEPTLPCLPSLQAHHDALSEAMVAASYDVDWLWQQAYGANGRAAARADAWFAIDALHDALALGNNTVSRAAESLRDALGSRYLTAMHARQWYWILGQAAQRRLDAPTLQQVQAALEQALRALVYPDVAYQSLLHVQSAIAADAAAALLPLRVASSPAAAAESVGWMLAYFGESLVHQQTTPLQLYVARWQAHYLLEAEQQATLDALAAVLRGGFERHLPAAMAQRAIALLGVLNVKAAQVIETEPSSLVEASGSFFSSTLASGI